VPPPEPAEGSGATRAAGGDRPWLVAGLGNPGSGYEWTPHNLGFLVVDRLSQRNSIKVTRKQAQALVGAGRFGGKPVVLAKPQTYMNLSGSSVKVLLEAADTEAGKLVVVHDDLDLDWTAVRIRGRGSSGGHKGVASVIRSVGTMEFCRVRLGIGPGRPVYDAEKFVLTPIGRAQRKELDELLDYASAAVETIITEGVEKSMTKYNRRALERG
jgi:PTH1 family peptidyl-tRNA hydrolase